MQPGAPHSIGAARIVRGRDVDSALRRAEQFNFKADLVYAEDRAIVDQLRIPHLFYGRSESPESIVAALEKMLAGSA